MTILYDAYSDIGNRENNEDSFCAVEIPEGSLFVVADGLGGYGQGEIASDIAVETVRQYCLTNEAADLRKPIEDANLKILSEQRLRENKMKTTIAVAVVGNTTTSIAHVGDSRIYAFKNGEIVYQSVDHSVSQLAVFNGDITVAEIRNHEDRNILVRALGNSESIKVDISLIDNNDYDALLLCSDGFWECIWEDDMCEQLNSSNNPKDWLNKMKELLIQRKPTDNNTAITVIKK